MKTRPCFRAPLALSVPLLAFLAAGCEAATNAANGAGAAIEHTAEKIGQKADDAAIVIAVKGSLIKADDKLSKVTVGSLDGVVSLAGTVPTADHKAKAEAIAMQTKGVVKVMNAIDVAPPQ
jgi:hyperosmotically inducible protein